MLVNRVPITGGVSLTVDVLLDRLVGQNGTTVDINFVTDGDIVTEHRDILQPGPLANRAVPPDNGGLDPGVILDLASSKQDTALQSDAVANNDVGPNGDVGAYAAVLTDLGGGVDHDVTAIDIRLSVGSELL